MTEFNSNNTRRLNLEETKEKIASLAIFKKNWRKCSNMSEDREMGKYESVKWKENGKLKLLILLVLDRRLSVWQQLSIRHASILM